MIFHDSVLSDRGKNVDFFVEILQPNGYQYSTTPVWTLTFSDTTRIKEFYFGVMGSTGPTPKKGILDFVSIEKVTDS